MDNDNTNNIVWYLDDELNEHETERNLLRDHGYQLVVTRYESYKDDYPKYAPYVKGILLQVSFPPFGEEDMAGLKSCKIISVPGGGYNHLDVESATKRGIVATYVPGYCVEEVSDHTIAFIFALNKRLPECQEMTRKNQWRAIDVGHINRLKGQVLGLLGFGRIAKLVAKKAKNFGLEVKAYDPYVPKGEMDSLQVQHVEFDELVSTSDFLSLHVLLTDETSQMINAQVFDAMKNTAYLINTCRGNVVDEADLIKALKEKAIAGAGLDVLAIEPPSLDNPLLFMTNVIVTPHSSFISIEALNEVRVRSTMAVIDVLEGRVPKDIINSEVLNANT